MKIKITLVLILSVFSLRSQAQLLNGGFEDWTNNGTFTDPDHWFSLNASSTVFGVTLCEEGTPGYVGAKYVKLTSKNIAGIGVIGSTLTSGEFNASTGDYTPGFPFTQRPASLTGSWRYMANGADQGSAFVVLSKWNTINQSQDVIAAATINLPGSVSNWTAFDIPLNYILTDAPDTATIYFTSSAGSPVDGSYLYVDNVAFAGTAAGINTISPQIMIDVYPNPASDFIYILKTTSEKETKFEISSIVGNIVQSGILKNSRTKIELKNLSKGVYFVNVFSESSKTSKRLVVN